MTCPTCHPEASENQHDNLYLGLGDFFLSLSPWLLLANWTFEDNYAKNKTKTLHFDFKKQLPST